ncbi:RNHCP domain-containing protein [Ferroacidibacillus organovorans]|uniref:RNHCP domain-containing protein n=1 Tax=Ferroacidibacillus organovorans TaxID=1765683 RepID=A0A162T3N7_9BACL|nr:RNHCP domain-containing protein [Ferroacidibacillus organovorans]KYP80431.1 RNHCP domain-containing protein [Ferroacidibacillus organovorans]OAG89945.1 hypothetical protein AYW79_14330 [Ferroacidibacillus organovorans]OPG16628.1 RNHCP domain-containing protein [Ferroacidibacillus organovorans]
MRESRHFTVINEPFTCIVCNTQVAPLRTGCRNHCPACLHSVHVDRFPGDRQSECGGLLVPEEIVQDSKKGFMIVHRCNTCGELRTNKAALDDPAQPDHMDAILDLMKNRALTKRGRQV